MFTPSQESEGSEDFDPKTFLESLFKGQEADIRVIFHNNTRNETGEIDNNRYNYKPDVYFVIGAVSFIILLILALAIYKAVVMLKISLNDGIDDTVPVENESQFINGELLFYFKTKIRIG